jgi:hypothetical protein
MPDPITGAIDHVRLMVNAIVEGRIEARTVKDMSDEQLVDYIARLRQEAGDAVEAGYRMHDPPQ